MSWTRVGASVATAAFPGAATLGVAKPAGVAEGDLLVFGVVCQALSAFPAQVGAEGIHALSIGSGVVGGTFFGVAGASDPATYDWDGEAITSISCTAYRGVGTALVADAVGTDPLPEVETLAGDLLVALAFAGTTAGTPGAGYVATPPGFGLWSEAADVVQSSGLATHGHAVFDCVASGGSSGAAWSVVWGGTPNVVGSAIFRFAPAFVVTRHPAEVVGRILAPAADGRFLPVAPAAGAFLTPGEVRGRVLS